MSVSLTFFKKRGSKEADEFRGVIGYRGCPLNEWDYLTLDTQLRETGVKLVVQEYTDVADLPSPWDSIVKNAICLDLRCGAEKSEQYPDKGSLTAPAIKAWILGVLKSQAPDPTDLAADGPEVVDTGNGDRAVVESTEGAAGTGSDAAEVQPDSDGSLGELLQESGRSAMGFSLGLAGTLLVAAMAIAGGIGGAILADREPDETGDVGQFVDVDTDNEGGGTLYLLTEDGDVDGKAQKADFGGSRRPWDEAPPRQKATGPTPPSSQTQPTGQIQQKTGTDGDPTIGF